MTDMKKLVERQNELQAELAKNEEQIKEAKRAKMIQCAACGKRSRISSVVYIQTRWHEGPYGCTGGDRWHDGEGCFKCPKCNVRNRLLSGGNLRDNPDDFAKVHPYSQLKHSFQEIVRISDNQLDRNFVNHHMNNQGKVIPGMNFSSVKGFYNQSD